MSENVKIGPRGETLKLYTRKKKPKNNMWLSACIAMFDVP